MVPPLRQRGGLPQIDRLLHDHSITQSGSIYHMIEESPWRLERSHFVGTQPYNYSPACQRVWT